MCENMGGNGESGGYVVFWCSAEGVLLSRRVVRESARVLRAGWHIRGEEEVVEVEVH